MKKVLAALMSAAMLVSNVSAGALAAESDDPFEGKDSVNIVYLGGSITQGAGVSDKSQCWVSRIGDYFEEKYPDKTINNYNEGLGGTGSDMGIMRLERDVLSKDPDYVFIEFAVNDIGKSTASRHMESIVRSLCELDEVPYVTFVYTAKYDSANKCLQNNSEAHQAVADYYGIPTIDMKPGLEDSILSTGTMEDEDNVKQWLVDLTHPTAAGYDSYTKTIEAALETGDYYVRPQQKTEKLDINSYPLSTEWTSAASAKATGTWAENENPSYGCGLTSSTPGDTLEFTFSGSVLGIQHRIGKECGQYTLNIDGKDIGTIDTYYSKTTSQGVLGYQNFALGAGEHRVKITVLDTKNEAIADGTATPVAFDWFITEQSPSPYRWINENYEDCDFSRLVPSGSMSYDWSQTETALGSGGSMKVTVTGNSSGPSYRCETVAGTTYNVSAWIKVENIDEWELNENSDKVRFIFQPKVLNEDGSWGGGECYTECVVTDAGIISGDWVKVTAQYVCDGKGKVVGNSDRVAASDISRVEIRLGSGNLAATTGSADVPEIYYVDDFKVEPVSTEPEEELDPGNIIEDGSFDTPEAIETWSKDGNSVIEYAEGGANGTAGAALIRGTETGQNIVGIAKKLVPVRANRAYKVSYWVKAANDAALGAYPQMIVEYRGKQTDPSTGSTSYYPNYDMCAKYGTLPALTDEWQKVEFIYKKDGVTNDVCIYPNMQIRLYSSEGGGDQWTGDYPEFYVDEVRMDELDIVYDGDFAVDPASQQMSTTPKYRYPWGKYNNSQNGVVWTEGADADGTNSYLSVTQSNTDEIQTYIDLEEGESYRLSFYARLDNWETQSASALADSGLYITAIINKARSDLSEQYTSQYQYLPCSNTGETDIERWVMSDEWQKFEAEFTVPVQNEGVKHRNGYMSFRLGTGNETATYSIDGVMIEKLSSGASPVPALSNAAVEGDAVKDMPLTVSVDYSCSSDCAAYVYRVYSGSEEAGYIEKAYEETAEPSFTYIPDAADVGKNIKFEIRAIANNGNYSNIVYAETGPVAESQTTYETSAAASFDNEAWSTRLSGTLELTAGEGGADFTYALAVYDEDGILESIIYDERTLSGNTTESVPVSMAVSRSAYEAKLMVWDENMVPYCDAAVLVNE